jgi:hypothetical protein
MESTWSHTATVSASYWRTLVARGNEFFAASKSVYFFLYSADGVAWEEVPIVEKFSALCVSYDDVVAITTLANSYINRGGKDFLYGPMSFGSSSPNWIKMVWNGANRILPIKEFSNHKYSIGVTVVTPGSAGTVTLGEIVYAESMLSELIVDADVDVTTLTPLVTGYRVSSVGAIRGAIEQLQAAWPFDVVQHGYGIRYVLRSTATSIATIPASDLDARSDGSAPGVQITISREMDSQLHRRVTVQHLDYDREYNVGTQYAERLNTSAINATVLDLPIVLTSTEAAGKAEVLLYLYWLERYDVAVNLPPTYNHLEPGDVVTLVTPEGNVSLRLTAVTYTSDGQGRVPGEIRQCGDLHADGGRIDSSRDRAYDDHTGGGLGLCPARPADDPQRAVRAVVSGGDDRRPGGMARWRIDAIDRCRQHMGEPGGLRATGFLDGHLYQLHRRRRITDDRQRELAQCHADTRRTVQRHAARDARRGKPLCVRGRRPMGDHRRADLHAGERHQLRAAEPAARSVRERVGNGVARRRRCADPARHHRRGNHRNEFGNNRPVVPLSRDYGRSGHQHRQQPIVCVSRGQSQAAVTRLPKR